MQRYPAPTLASRQGFLTRVCFDDGAKLLAAAEKMGLEGVVSKRRDAPYRSGARSGWIKVKTLDWLVRNRDRWRLFERRK